MGEQDRLAERFETHRGHLRAVAYRMLGSLSEADDAVQEAWLRLSRADADSIENLTGWLTRVVARVCLDMLRARTTRREEPLGLQPPGVITDGRGRRDPEQEALLAEEVGLALVVVLDRLAPTERVAFVLHDLFAVPFEEIAPIVERTPTATKKLASRARHRVHGTATRPGTDRSRQRHVVDAFLAATRGGDIEALLAVLDPDVARRADRAALRAGAATELRGAQAVAEETATNARVARFAAPALVNGRMGLVVARAGGCCLPSGSRSRARRSPRSTRPPTPCASASSTWPSPPTDGPIHRTIPVPAGPAQRLTGPPGSPSAGRWWAHFLASMSSTRGELDDLLRRLRRNSTARRSSMTFTQELSRRSNESTAAVGPAVCLAMRKAL